MIQPKIMENMTNKQIYFSNNSIDILIKFIYQIYKDPPENFKKIIYIFNDILLNIHLF